MDYSRIYKYQPDDEEPKKETTQEETEIDGSELDSSASRFPGFKILMFVLVASLLIIFYVVNVIKVKSLLQEESKLEKQLDNIDDKNQILRAKINELESPERITKIASDKFKMIKPDALPEVIRDK